MSPFLPQGRQTLVTNDIIQAPSLGAAWPIQGVGGLPPSLVTRVEQREVTEGWQVRVLREVVDGRNPLVSQVAWSRTVADTTTAGDLFEALEKLGTGLALFAETSLVLPAERNDALIDAALARISGERNSAASAAQVKEAKRLADEEKRRIRSLELAAYFVGEKKTAALELRRGGTKAFLRVNFGAEWERERFWDWLKWQKSRFAEIESRTAELGAAEVIRLLLYEMLACETAVKKRGLGAGGRRPLIFWRGDQ